MSSGSRPAEIAGRDLRLGPNKREAATQAAVRAYRVAMLEFAEIRKALTRDHLHAFDRFIETVDDDIRFVNHAPLLVPVEELLDHDQRERYVEVICDFLLLQLKEAQPSVLQPYVRRTASYESNGQRVVEGQRLMQAVGDPLLGWYQLRALDDRMHDFYVRQLWDGKASIEIADLDPAGFTAYSEICGWTLARAHARSGDRIAIATYLGGKNRFDRSIAEYAATYADMNDSDHQRLMDAIADGRLSATVGL